jgi:hypothetical protein
MIRHSRQAQFVDALTTAPDRQVRRWSELASDPNAPPALVHRADRLHRGSLPGPEGA